MDEATDRTRVNGAVRSRAEFARPEAGGAVRMPPAQPGSPDGRSDLQTSDPAEGKQGASRENAGAACFDDKQPADEQGVTAMQAVRIKTTIDQSHRLEIDLPPELPVGEVEVIVLAAESARRGSASSLLEFLRQLDARPIRNPRTPQEIEAGIAAERDSWG